MVKNVKKEQSPQVCLELVDLFFLNSLPIPFFQPATDIIDGVKKSLQKDNELNALQTLVTAVSF